ncbi:GntR family transcriptional regulator [Nesterenkonia sp. E16_7]|uniref:GntR family transcriptional regulator n=1 Tax=unclassified Nesterenkonia TaxID=2629769 RepID=UPI001A92B2E0|nr:MULTISPECIES: GntR family transcriptional regulator [unclassified Nesterenkonia]MBO0595533.1 GntR family transcriptional regulator [Nesterenkonia sp. E16_10]MBO0599021.1 GntR family transcriptional regulator [Nesterenkonia sp. E16_7]
MSAEPSRSPEVPAATEVVYLQLLRLLRDGRFRPGERLGTERGLAEQLQVPRSALRRALDRLEAEHQVRRAIGQSGGVFADDGKIQRHLNTVQGVPDMVRHQGLTVETQVLRAELSQPFAEEQRALQLPGTAPVLRIVRVRRAGAATWSLDTSVLPARRFPGLLAADLTSSLYALLTRDHGLVVDRAEETVEATTATTEQAGVLGIPEGAGLLEIHRITYDQQDAPVEYAHDFFRADRTRLHMQKVGTNWKRSQQ